MPKYCSVPHCRMDPGRRKSFYKFPLHEPERLQLWLRNMGRDNWIPSQHQYICHEHFAPSNFKVRWGIRYLENNAVPTLFQKRKVTEESERSKRLRANNNESIKVSGGPAHAPQGSPLQPVHMFKVTVDLSQLSQAGDSGHSLQTGMNLLPKIDQVTTEANCPLTLIQTVDGSGDNTKVVLMSDEQEEHGNGVSSVGLTEVQEMVVNEDALGKIQAASLRLEDVTCTTEDFCGAHEGHQSQDIAYFEIIPSVFSSPSAQLAFSPETVLSSALSSKPITSTLPIVSKHAQHSDTEKDNDDDVRLDKNSMEHQQLVEHCYHKNSLSNEELETIVAELQKKVKILQQRHRRHLDKLLGLEKIVGQLRQSNLLYEERLQLLERVYLQTNATISDFGETVTIIYEEENA